MKLRLLIAVGLSCAVALESAWAGSGTEGAAFLEIPVGAGPAALGSAYTALATDAYAPAYNAAGLGFLTTPELAGQHLSYIESIKYEYASFVLPFKGSAERSHGGLGISLQYLTPGQLIGRDDAGNATGDFSGHYAAYTLAYGYPVTSRWSLGLAGKLITAKIDDARGSAYAGDLGTMVKITPRWTAAATLTNLGSHLTLLDDGQVLPTATHLGTSYAHGSHWIFTAEGVFPAHDTASFHGGCQWQPFDLVQLRAGYRTDTLKETSTLAGLTVGAGLQLWGQELAYAWLPYGDLGTTQYFSFVFRFGASESGPKILHAQTKDQEALPVSGENTL